MSRVTPETQPAAPSILDQLTTARDVALECVRLVIDGRHWLTTEWYTGGRPIDIAAVGEFDAKARRYFTHLRNAYTDLAVALSDEVADTLRAALAHAGKLEPFKCESETVTTHHHAALRVVEVFGEIPIHAGMRLPAWVEIEPVGVQPDNAGGGLTDPAELHAYYGRLMGLARSCSRCDGGEMKARVEVEYQLARKMIQKSADHNLPTVDLSELAILRILRGKRLVINEIIAGMVKEWNRTITGHEGQAVVKGDRAVKRRLGRLKEVGAISKPPCMSGLSLTELGTRILAQHEAPPK